MCSLRKCLVCLIVFFCVSSFAQSRSKIYHLVKRSNNSHYSISDSSILISYQITNRFTGESNLALQAYQINSLTIDTIDIIMSNANGTFLLENNQVTPISKDGDTFPVYFTSKTTFKEDTYSSYFYAIEQIPTLRMRDFLILRYSRPKIEFAEDTMVLVQRDRQNNETRRLYIDSNFRVVRLLSFNNDSNRADAKFNIEFKYFKNNCFDSLNQAHYLGKYWKNKEEALKKKELRYKQKLSDTFHFNNDTLKLLNGDFRLKRNYQYFILDYWYLSCPPCIKMHPIMQNIDDILDTSKALLIGVNPFDTKDNIDNYMIPRNYTLSQLDYRNNSPPMEVSEFPKLFILDSDWNILEEITGYSGKSTQSHIEKILKEYKLLD